MSNIEKKKPENIQLNANFENNILKASFVPFVMPKSTRNEMKVKVACLTMKMASILFG